MDIREGDNIKETEMTWYNFINQRNILNNIIVKVTRPKNIQEEIKSGGYNSVLIYQLNRDCGNNCYQVSCG